MLADGVRLVLAVVIPLAAAAVAHELEGQARARMAVAVVALVSAGFLAASIAGDTAAGATVERGFGSAIPGVSLTVRGDSLSVTAMVATMLGGVLAVAARRREEGVLLCAAGAATVAVAGSIVLTAAGVLVAGAGVLLLTAPGGPGRRGAAALSAMVVGCGLALFAVAALLLAKTGSTDPTVTPATSVTAAVAIPWALAAALLIAAPLMAGAARRETPAWAAMVAVPAGAVVLVRLAEAAGGALPPPAATLLGVAGTLLALASAAGALRARDPRAALAAAAGVLTAAVLVGLAGEGSPAATGLPVAGLLVALELTWLAATVTTAARLTTALAALPGGLAVVALVLSVAPLVARGSTDPVELVAIVGGAACAAIAAARQLVTGRVLPASAIPAPGLLAAVAGGVVPGLVLPLAGRITTLGGGGLGGDAAAVHVPGAGWAAGYVVVALGIVAAAVISARVLLARELRPAPDGLPAAPASRRTGIAAILAIRRRAAGPAAALGTALVQADQWMVAQPGVALVAIVAAVAIVVVR